MKINDVIHGFKLLRQETVDEIASEAFIFEHVKSGAKLMYLKNDDDNKVFSACFRTPPTDDTGVPHIIEHSTLCGSRKFPLKEPFVELVKGSLNTFLNAMTYPDKTMYPIASLNNKDFHNLMDVYLDAVFYPSIYKKPEILLQEGWHYEIDSPDAPLTYSGVVFNEMKGAISDPDDQLENECFSAVFPDSIYSNESGGNPEFIPDLTYEQFIEFHKKYYSPANCYLYLYGNLDIDEQLSFINDEYLQNFDRIEVDSAIGFQKPFDETVIRRCEYPVGAQDDTTAKTFLNYTAIIGDSSDIETNCAMSVICRALLQSEGAPVRQALMDAGIGMDVDASFDDSIMQPILKVTVTGSEAERLETFRAVLMDSFKEQVAKGIDKTLLEASLNYIEFKLREADFGNTPKGLVYHIVSMTTWLYDGDPLQNLRYEAVMKKLQEAISTDYYEKILQKNVIDNQHSAFVVMSPSKTMAAERDAKIADKLAQVKAGMTDDDIKQVIETTAKLKEMQQTPDSPEALATIPLLEISDISPDSQDFHMEERELDGAKILFSNVNTNGIAYVNIFFDLKTVPQDMLQYVYFLADVIGAVDTEKHTYAEIANLEGLHTGGIDYRLNVNNNKKWEDGFNIMFKVSGRAFIRKLPEMFDIIGEVCTSSKYTDKKRIKELLMNTLSSTQMAMMQSSIQLVMSKLGSHMTPVSAIEYECTLPKYRFLKKMMADYDNAFDDLAEKLTDVARTLFNRQNLIIGVTLKEEEYPQFATECSRLLSLLPNEKRELHKYQWEFNSCREAFSSPAQIQYVAKGANLNKLGCEEVSGVFRIMDMILKYEYFWTKIRVQGGAYGALTRIATDGELIFASYRDPNLKTTVDVFDGTADFLANFNATEREMTKYIIGTISHVDIAATPKMKGIIAQSRWLRGITKEMWQKRRNQILNATVGDIRALAPIIDKAMKENNLCVFGNEVVINDCRDMFQKITNIME